MRMLPAALAGLLGSASLAALLATSAAAAPGDGRFEIAQAQQQGQAPSEEEKKRLQQRQHKGPPEQKGAPPSAKQLQLEKREERRAPKVLTPTPPPKLPPKMVTPPPTTPPKALTTPPVTAPKVVTPPPTTAPKAVTPPPLTAPKTVTTPPPETAPKAFGPRKGPRFETPPSATTGQPPAGTAESPTREQRKFRRFGGQRPDEGAKAGAPAGVAPVTTVPQGAYKQFTKTTPDPRFKRVDDIKTSRHVKTEGNIKVITEPGNRTIIRQDNRVFIRHDETERFRHFSKDVRTTRRPNGFNETVVVRPGGVRIISVFDPRGNLVERRRWWNGREVRLIDNRRHWGPGAKVALGVGVGLGLAALTVALAPPAFAMPRHKYIVEYADASPDDLYDALSADPVERLDRGYSLDEIRYSVSLRDRMRRVDLDVNFDFGAWDITPDQYGKLERIARVLSRIIEKNPDEVFMIEGHTDAVGSDEDNLSLSDRRAESVATVLTREFEVPPENLVTQGYGEQFLKVPTEGPERANRRVTVRRVTPLMAREEGVGPGGDRD